MIYEPDVCYLGQLCELLLDVNCVNLMVVSVSCVDLMVWCLGLDEYLKIVESTSIMCLKLFVV